MKFHPKPADIFLHNLSLEATFHDRLTDVITHPGCNIYPFHTLTWKKTPFWLDQINNPFLTRQNSGKLKGEVTSNFRPLILLMSIWPVLLISITPGQISRFSYWQKLIANTKTALEWPDKRQTYEMSRFNLVLKNSHIFYLKQREVNWYMRIIFLFKRKSTVNRRSHHPIQIPW